MSKSRPDPSHLPAIPQDYRDIPLPAGADEAWAEVERRARKDHIKLGLRLLLSGYTYREAADAAGVANGTLWDRVREFGLRKLVAGEDRIVNSHRENAIKAAEALSQRLNEPDNLTASELNFIGGTSTDKVLAFKKIEGDQTDREGAMERLARQVVQHGGRLHLTIESGDVRQASVEAGVHQDSRMDASQPQTAPSEIARD